MILHTKLTRVFISDKDKQGNPLMGKFGPYKKIAIKTESHADKWLSGFISKSTDITNTWKEGDFVDIVIEQNGQWLNFKPASRLDMLESRVKRLEDVITTLLQDKNGRVEETDMPSDSDDINASDLPF